MAVNIYESEGLTPPTPGQAAGPSSQPSSAVNIYQSEGIAPPDVPEMHPLVKAIIQNKPYEALDAIRKSALINPGVQALQTIGQSAANVINLAAKGGRKVEELVGVQPSGAPLNLQVPKVAIPGPSADLGKLIGGGAIMAAGGELAAIPKLGEAVFGAGKVLPGMLERAVGGAAVAPALAPKHPVKAALETLAMSPVADVATLGAGKVIGKGLAAVKNKKAIIQKVLRSFFSKDAAHFIKNKISGIMTDLKGSSSKETSSNDLYNRLNTHYEELGKDNSTRGPDDVPNTYVQPGNSVGDAYARVPVNLPADQSVISKKITSQIGELKSKMAPFAATSQAKAPYQDAINQLSDIKKANIQTVGDAQQLKEIINNNLRDKTLNPVVKPYLTDLRDNAIKGEKGAISVGVGKADPQAASLLREADTRYKNEMVPFQETDRGKASPFWKMKKGIEPSDKIGSQYLKPGAQKDQQALLQNFLKMTPPDEGSTRKLLAYDHFKDIDDKPAAIVQRWSKLGEGQKQALLPEHKEELDQLAKLQKQYPDAFREASPAALGKQIKGVAKIGAGLTLAGSGHIALSALPFIIPSLASKAVRNAFENPEMQKTFIEDLASKNLIGKGDIPIGVHYLRNILAAAPAVMTGSDSKTTKSKEQ